MDAGDKVPTVGALGDAGSNYRKLDPTIQSHSHSLITY